MQLLNLIGTHFRPIEAAAFKPPASSDLKDNYYFLFSSVYPSLCHGFIFRTDLQYIQQDNYTISKALEEPSDQL